MRAGKGEGGALNTLREALFRVRVNVGLWLLERKAEKIAGGFRRTFNIYREAGMPIPEELLKRRMELLDDMNAFRRQSDELLSEKT